MDALTLQGWRPVRLYHDGNQTMVDWARLGDAPLRAPFYQESLKPLLSLPFNQAFRRQTPLQVLLDWQAQSPGITPCLLVFHVSRCGSTLFPQALAQSAHHLAMSEPPPVDFLLREARVNGWLSPAQSIAALRAWMSAWTQRSDAASPALQSASLKIDAWNTDQAPLLMQAWPEALPVFLTREPLAVLVSQMQERAFYLVPGAFGPTFGLPGLSLLEQATMPPAQYCARMLGRIYADMARVADPAQALVLDHAQLPEAIEQWVLPRMSWQPDAKAMQALRERLSRHGKRPHEPFGQDTLDKHAKADAALRALAAQWMAPPYQQLRARCDAHDRAETLTEAAL